jgi:uncharacterized protein YqfB (UPF0267 family)
MAKLILKVEDANNPGTFTATGNPLKDQSCASTIHVEFVDDNDGNLTLVEGEPTPNTAEYGTPAWVIYGPDLTGVNEVDQVPLLPGTGGQNGTTNPQTFVPVVPGKYLIVLQVKSPAGADEKYSSLYEVPDAQIPGASIPAPNERDEFDTDEGWARGIERFLAATSSMLSHKKMVTIKNNSNGPFQTGQLVRLTEYERWRNSNVDETHYRNFVWEAMQTMGDASPLNAQSALVAHGDLGLVLKDIAPGKTGYVLLRGFINFDTSTWAVNDNLFVAENTPELTNSANVTNKRHLGIVARVDDANTDPPGTILFDGTGVLLAADLIVGLLQSPEILAELIKFTPAVPANVQASDPWLYVDNNGDLIFGTAKIAEDGILEHTTVTFASSNGTYNVPDKDTFISVDTTGGTIAIVLPAAGIAYAGRLIVIKDNAGNISTNPINVYPSAGNLDQYTANGPLSLVIDWSSVSCYCDGTQWLIY